MSSAALALDKAARFYDAPIGKKVIMAVTGVILFGFVIGHMLGNLQIYLPKNEAGVYPIDAYGKFLHGNMELLWGARIVLLTSVVLHIVASIQLTAMKMSARPVAYAKKDNSHSSYASRTMMWSGPIVAAFIVYHLLHFTTGQAHPNFKELQVHDNVIAGFSNPLASGFYILAMVLLGTHLYHGAWSMFQSLGVSHPRYTPALKTFAKVMAAVIVLGNISIPIAVLAGVIK